MNVKIFFKYPELEKQFETLCKTRRNEILSHIVETDNEYENLRCKRADASMALKNALDSTNAGSLLEEYSDAVYEQEIYELDAIRFLSPRRRSVFLSVAES